MNSLPALRTVDAAPVEHEGDTYICISDPAGFVEDQLLLSPAAFMAASCLDGARDAEGVCSAFASLYPGVRIQDAQVHEVVRHLDEHGFLWSNSFVALHERIVREFHEGPVRPAYHAGRGYPDDAGALRAFLDAFFMASGGLPGRQNGHAGAPLRGLIVPHIDFTRGAAAYSHGYRRLFEAGRPKVVFIFGVAHAGPAAPFVLTRKHYETPFGILDTEQGIVDTLAAACSWAPFDDEILHRTEHSIEFQAVMLSYFYGTDLRIVPILCGSLCGETQSEQPEQQAGVQAFLAACRECAAAVSGHSTIIAGADLAHVGRRFGDDFDIVPPIIDQVTARDREDLAHVTQPAAEAFYASVMRDGNERKVCGINCIYAALKTVGATAPGQLLYHGHAPDPAGGIVSFASIALP